MELTKALKRELREINEVGRERALALALKELDAQFTAWKAGEIDPFDLSYRIHVFHKEVRQLHARFDDRILIGFNVSVLVLDGLLTEADFTPKLWDALAESVEDLRITRAHWNDDTVDEAG